MPETQANSFQLFPGFFSFLKFELAGKFDINKVEGLGGWGHLFLAPDGHFPAEDSTGRYNIYIIYMSSRTALGEYPPCKVHSIGT